MMKYEEFICEIKSRVENLLGEDYRTELKEVVKNNNKKMTALVIAKKDACIAPSIYLEQLFEGYEKGVPIEVLCDEVIALYEGSKDRISYNIEEFLDFEKAKNNIAYKLINFEANKELLSEVPFIPFLDLAIVFYCIVNIDGDDKSTILIRNSHLKHWDKSIYDIYTIADKNTRNIMGCSVRNMSEILEEIIFRKFISNESGQEDEINELIDRTLNIEESIKMFVVSNNQGIFGAASILYKDFLKDFAMQLSSDLLIIPSSIHETIIIPWNANNNNREEVNDMVKIVNQNELSQTDMLSDHTYIYSLKEERIIA